MSKSRRLFLTHATGLSFAGPTVMAAICAGCDESVPPSSQPDPQKQQEAQDKQKEFMQSKKGAKKK